jgi:hypothetical protein
MSTLDFPPDRVEEGEKFKVADNKEREQKLEEDSVTTTKSQLSLSKGSKIGFLWPFPGHITFI